MYLVALLFVFVSQGYLMVRFVPRYLSAFLGVPTVYMHIEKVISTIAEMWASMLVLAVLFPVLLLLAGYFRRRRGEHI